MDGSAADLALLASAIERLAETGSIEYTGEYGAEITTFIPFVFWLKREGHLENRRVVTYGGMRPYYYFLSDAEYSEKDELRRWLPFDQRDWPSPKTHCAVSSPWHFYPDYRTAYESGGPSFARPVLFIQNKFNVEFGIGPINYLPLRVLSDLLLLYSNKFTIIYSRTNIGKSNIGYSEEEDPGCNYPDRSVLKKYPQVIVLEDHCAEQNLPYNLTKLQILAKSRAMIGVQGGGSHLLACFGNSVLVLLHKGGPEDPHAYAVGPYKYLATPPPALLVTRSFSELQRATDILHALQVKETAIEIIGDLGETLLEEFGV